MTVLYLVLGLGFGTKEAKILFLGLDGAGKSTLLYRLSTHQFQTLEPTRTTQSEQVRIGRVEFNAIDLGGHHTVRSRWLQFSEAVDGVVFMIDVSRRDRFPQAALELAKLLQAPELSPTAECKLPFLILGNKIDLPEAIQLGSQLRSELEQAEPRLSTLLHQRKVAFFMCSVINSTGYDKGLQWLSGQV